MNFANIIDYFDHVQILQQNVLLKRLVIIAIYAILSKIADIFIDRVFKKIASRTKISFDDQLISLVHAPICWTIFWLGILHALAIQPPLQDPWQTVLPPLAKSAILLAWLISLIRGFNLAIENNQAKIIAQGKIGADLFLLLKNLLRVVAIVAGLLWLLAIWKINLTPLFASAGIAGIAVALAAKDTLANFFGGISIFMDKTFKAGDYIILDGNERGEVVEIGIRSTRIKTRDDVLITIPNSIIANSKIVNESAPVPSFRIRVPVGVAYGTDLEKVEQILLKVASENPNVAANPIPRARVRTFDNSSVNFELLLWVADPSVKGLETHKLLKAIYLAFAENNIVIPFPQTDVHLHTTNEPSPQNDAESNLT